MYVYLLVDVSLCKTHVFVFLPLFYVSLCLYFLCANIENMYVYNQSVLCNGCVHFLSVYKCIYIYLLCFLMCVSVCVNRDVCVAGFWVGTLYLKMWAMCRAINHFL